MSAIINQDSRHGAGGLYSSAYRLVLDQGRADLRVVWLGRYTVHAG